MVNRRDWSDSPIHIVMDMGTGSDRRPVVTRHGHARIDDRLSPS